MTESGQACTTDLVHEMLKTGKVQSFFQPVVSIQKKSILGFEAFARGLSGDDNQVLKPGELFAACHDSDTQLEVDRVCRNAALEQFRNIYKAHKNVLLFLNVNLDAYRSPGVDKDLLLKTTTKIGYDPQHIVIEFEESKIRDDFPLDLFNHFKSLGFKFSIDDIGAGGLGIDKLFMIRPDFIKVSRAIFADAREKPYKMNVLKSLRKAAEELGCTVVGKSVEEEDEAFILLENDITHQQGFFYTKTKGDDSGKDALEIFKEKIANVHNRYCKHISECIKSRKEMFDSYHKLSSKIMFRLESAGKEELPEMTKRICIGIKDLAGIFILDDTGRQITPRMTRIETSDGKPAIRESGRNEDHAIKDYVLYLNMGFDKFVTPPFVSPLTKREHTIISRRFFNRDGLSCVVCVEFPYVAE